MGSFHPFRFANPTRNLGLNLNLNLIPILNLNLIPILNLIQILNLNLPRMILRRGSYQPKAGYSPHKCCLTIEKSIRCHM